MRILLLALLLASVAFSRPMPAYEEAQIAYFSFNSCDARDDSGQGSFGILEGNVRCWCGVEDEGLLFDGETAYLTFQGLVNNYFSTSDFTISFYFKPEMRSAFPISLLSKRGDCGEDFLLDILLDYSRQEITTLVQQSEHRYYGNLSPEPREGGWQHFALVREGTRARTYVNGIPQRESFRCSGVDISNEAPLAFGNSPCVQTGRARRFRGVLDELRVFDRALTDEEILDLYRRHPIENAQMDCYS